MSTTLHTDGPAGRPAVLAVIPARGGSKGIPRKNARFIGGKPLISYAVANALKSAWITHVVVSTDDEELAHISRIHGASVIMRPARFARDEVPLDPVIHHATEAMEASEGVAFDAVITLQPTSPLLRAATIDHAFTRFYGAAEPAQAGAPTVDTLLSAMDDRHLAWTMDGDRFVPLYAERLNRQLLPAEYRETGGFVIARRAVVTPSSRFGPRVSLALVPDREAIDIDTPTDWWIAEKLLNQRRILLRVDGDRVIGLGHVYRMLLLAERLIDHQFLFVTSADQPLGAQVIEGRHYPVRQVASEAEWQALVEAYDPHMVIHDLLDTPAAPMEWLRARGIFVVNFEDLGPGARVADLVINALYEEPLPLANHVWGPDYYCLRDEFRLTPPKVVEPAVREVLLTFGGTDANNYTCRLLTLVAETLPGVAITVITGPGYAHGEAMARQVDAVRAGGAAVEVLSDVRTISQYMRRADLALTSAGRTVYELASIGTPTVVLAQNPRELTHTFASASNGIINLGLGTDVADDTVRATLRELVQDVQLRTRCSDLMRRQDVRRGVDNVVRLMFDRLDAHQRTNEDRTKEDRTNEHRAQPAHGEPTP